MTPLVDQTGHSLTFFQEPVRLVSLVPSLTQTLCDAGLEHRVVGVTKFCIHPENIRKDAQIIGGTKNPRIEDIILLKPDLILANKEENRREDIELLQKDFPVYTTDIKTMDDFALFCRDMAGLFPHSGFESIGESADNVIRHPYQGQKLKVCYLIWKEPYMTIGGDTFIHHMMEHHGFKNIFSHHLRYPEILVQDMNQSQADFVFLSSEPYPFKEKDVQELSALLPSKKVIYVDGEMFSWYGSAIPKAHDYLRNLLNQCLKNMT